MSDQITESNAVQWAGAGALLYVLAALDEVEKETALYLLRIRQIRSKYRRELEAGSPEQFNLLCAMAERTGMVGEQANP